MKVLYDDLLSKSLRKAVESAKQRIWIAVPFIGSWGDVERILGNKWHAKKNLDIRLLTDSGNERFINKETYLKFAQRAETRSLCGLHAKIYLIDDYCLITSANLTGTAFCKRYEIGLTVDDSKEVAEIFNQWWNKAEILPKNWEPTNLPIGNSKEEPASGPKFKKRFELPNMNTKKTQFQTYKDLIEQYKEFVSNYSKQKRLLPNLTLYHEVDSFFNFLFHEHPDKPSAVYLRHEYSKLSPSQMEKRFHEYYSYFEGWLKIKPTREDYRLDRISVIQKYLAPSQIKSLKPSQIKLVVDSLHCMNSLALNKTRFLNPQNNNLNTIINAWSTLLHDDKLNIEERMDICNKNLVSFSKSSIYELLAWYYPDVYPTINRNSNSGMKFLGYDVPTY